MAATLCHSGLSGIFPVAFRKDSRRALLAGMTTKEISINCEGCCHSK
jgi:hypothetical protein